MKKLAVAVGAGMLWLGAAWPVLAVDSVTVPVPSQCSGMTFDNTITATNAKVVTGTSGADLIVVGNANKVDGGGGNDCIMAGTANAIMGGAGNDVIVVTGTSNRVDGGGGNDKLYALATGNKLLGGAGDDTISGVGNTSVDGGPGMDTCTTDALKGLQKNCEPAVLTALAHMAMSLGL